MIVFNIYLQFVIKINFYFLIIYYFKNDNIYINKCYKMSSVVMNKLKDIIRKIDNKNHKFAMDDLYTMSIPESDLEYIIPYVLFNEFYRHSYTINLLCFEQSYENYNNFLSFEKNYENYNILVYCYRYSAVKILNYLKYENI